MLKRDELIEKVAKYDPFVDKEGIGKAYDFCIEKHANQKRSSGDPYYSHPIAVARIIAENKLDSNTIKAALLHDTVEDTEATLDDIEDMFGSNVAQIVDGVTKLSKIKYDTHMEEQADNFRKLIMATSDDIRVLLIKLADRLHNMRTLHFLPKPEKRQRIAHETMEIYAKLAERIGVHQIKEELQDLAFAELHKDARETIIRRLAFLRGRGEQIIEQTISYLEQTLKKEGIEAEISGREKKPYSIWRKMKIKNISFDQISDVMAFRIIVKDVQACYQTLGIIHSNYRVVSGYFKDYISTPKPNGYKSLHTAIIGPDNQRIEIQIRTEEMHNIAEKGVAAHWAYKQGDREAQDGTQYRWIRELIEILEHAPDAQEVLENTRLEMYDYSVFCFTPKGDLLELPRNATPVDFAYAVHSAVGNTCVGARVNGRIVPLKTTLENGDQVEIIRSKNGHPSPNWEQFVVTGKARAEVRKFVRSQKREEYKNLGKAILSKAFSKAKFKLKDSQLEKIKDNFECKTVEDIYVGIGSGHINRIQVLDAVHPDRNKDIELKDEVPVAKVDEEKQKKSVVSIRGLIEGMAIHFAKCCHPIPGDPIIGIIQTGKGVTIHTADCEVLEKYRDTPERWLEVEWDSKTKDNIFIGRIKAIVLHASGSLATISNIIAQGEGNITNLKISNRDNDVFELTIDIQVKDADHLSNIIASLRANPVTTSVDRFM